ncbi:MAG: YcbK family protein [Hyphomicrobiaceae bacterium]|nr:YcbK family protein [Hyphomicrobiaceae bacterium]
MPYERPSTERTSSDAEHAPKSALASIVSFERSAIIGISLLLAASFALQSIVIAHGHVVGQSVGEARAAVAPAAPVPAESERIPRITGLQRLALLASHIKPNALAALVNRPAESAAAETADVHATAEAEIGLRSDTFGPDIGKKPLLRLASIGSLPSAAAALGQTDRASADAERPEQSVLVVRPGERKVQKEERGTAAAKLRPRILGRGSPRVEKVHFQAHTPERCLPVDLLDVIYDVAERFGEVQILSTFRDPERNRRVGGAEQSFHLSCQAIDFRVAANSQTRLLAYLEGRPEVGGLKRYPMGYFHIDNGPRRSW